MTARIVELRQGLLRQNDVRAAALRGRFRAASVFVVNLVSGPGAGKTRLLERTLTRLAGSGHRVAVLVGDVETAMDAERLGATGVPARQIQTHGLCHLDAQRIETHLDGWNLERIDILFIENIGNLVCTSNYDLGEDMRVALLSVTEGEEKPAKYPGLFQSCDLAIFSKWDLTEACEFNEALARKHLAAVRPDLPVLCVSSKTDQGLDTWLEALLARRTYAGKDD